MSLTAIFGTQHNVDTLQECARAVLILVYGLILVRLSGRRIFGKWSALDIIVSVIVGSSLSRALTGSAPLAGTLIAMAVLVLLHGLLGQAVARWRPIANLLEGHSIDLGRDGRMFPDERQKHSVSEADLHQALRGAGVEDVAETRLIALEPSGTLSVLKS